MMKKNFIKRVGKEIHDIYDNPFTLRGVGIGGWLLIEGYMIGSYNDLDRPNRLDKFIASKIDENYKKYFFSEWTKSYFTEDDLKLIKRHGFNSIRIPIDYQFLFEKSSSQIELAIKNENFSILDNIISICSELDLYVILDLHAAPGGQTGTNIDNSFNNRPELFENKIYQLQLCHIWKTIASHYKDEVYIAAYDLLNEPLPEWFSNYIDLLIPIYKDIIAEIRKVDFNHMITLEGIHWSTDWTCFTKILDENLLLQFHKYWNNPDIESIQKYLDVQEQLNVPIFMGEGGENNPLWYSSVFKMYDQLNISFNFWTYKKIDNSNSIITFNKPDNWTKLLQGELNREETKNGFDRLLYNVKFDNTNINEIVINSILRKNTFSTPGYAFDYTADGCSKLVELSITSSLRINAGVQITDRNREIIKPDFKQFGGEKQRDNQVLFLRLHKNEWVKYTFYNDKNDGYFRIYFKMDRHSKISIKINGKTHLIRNEYTSFFNDKKVNELVVRANEDTLIELIKFEYFSL